MSSYLFILCSKVITQILNRAKQQGLIHGVKIAKLAPSITHLMFTNDVVLFLWVNQFKAENLKSCLKLYQS